MPSIDDVPSRVFGLDVVCVRHCWFDLIPMARHGCRLGRSWHGTCDHNQVHRGHFSVPSYVINGYYERRQGAKQKATHCKSR